MLYEAWMADFYEVYQMQLSQGRRRDEILEELTDSIAPESGERQADIARWAKGEGDAGSLDQIDLEAFGQMLLREEVDR